MPCCACWPCPPSPGARNSPGVPFTETARLTPQGFTRTDYQSVPSPYATFAAFIAALGRGDHIAAEALVSEPTLVVTAQDPDFPMPKAWAWNVTVERQLPWATTVEAAYVGRRGLEAHPAGDPGVTCPLAGDLDGPHLGAEDAAEGPLDEVGDLALEVPQHAHGCGSRLRRRGLRHRIPPRHPAMLRRRTGSSLAP